jgi:signal transduction histidine kinase/CheY-like chemotaxis protein
MLSALLAAEQDALLARAGAASARDAASRAETLAGALERARSDAARLNEQLRAEHRRKDEFLAMLGHELRNPLAPLMNSIEVFRRGGAGKEVSARLYDVMARQVVHLTRLVDDLLDASRVSRGRIELQRETLMLPDVLREAVETTDGLIAQRGHRLTVRGLEQGLAVSGDRVRLLQVFENLLNNAAKYTDPGGQITLEMTREGPNVCVRLTDTGIGISPEILPSVFDLFMQAPAGVGHAQGGLGIGLTLARMLTELHGGRVTVDSAGTGRGSTFSVTLPLVPIPHVPAQQAAQRESNAVDTAPIHVIVVDDNRDAADALALLLREMGHTTEVAYTPAAALELPGRLRADLFLLDIGLPGMDGYELARQLRASTKSAAHFVALTGFGAPNGARRSLESGFDCHLVKPVSLESLRRIVGEVAGAAA